MSEYEFTVALLVRHPDIEPQEITQALSIAPLHAWKAGEPRQGIEGESVSGRYRESYWSARLTEGPQLASDQVSIESVLLESLAKLRRSFRFLQDLNAQGGSAELRVSIFGRQNFEISLLAESLALLGRLGVDVSLEVHPHPVRAASPVN